MRVISEREWEMLLAVWHLRYLATGQLYRGWYGDRSLNNCQSRLCRLAKDGVLERVRLEQSTWGAAWRLGRAGLAKLQIRYGEDFSPYQQLTSLFLPHLIETNAVFFALAAGAMAGAAAHDTTSGWRWAGLPFEWRGSHRSGLAFVERRRHPETGVVRRRDRMLRPDAIVTPKPSNRDAAAMRDPSPRPRVFVELDRATESIASTTGRTNIKAKLRAYRMFLTGRHASGGTWYEHEFPDARPVVVLFAIPESRRAERRRESILAAAQEARLGADAVVRCTTLGDADGIRDACGVPPCGVPMLLLPQENAGVTQPRAAEARGQGQMNRVSCFATRLCQLATVPRRMRA